MQSQVKAATPPPEPEDEFLILEDDTPLIYIPSKNSIRKRQKKTKTEQSSADKDSPTDNGTKEPVEIAQKDEELEKANPKQESQPVNQKMKKKDKKKEVTGPRNDKDDFLNSEDLPLGDLVEQEKPHKKKQQLKKVQSKEGDKADKKPKGSDKIEMETDEETVYQKLEKKTQKSSELKSSKSSKNGKGNTKKQHTEAEDLGSLSGKVLLLLKSLLVC